MYLRLCSDGLPVGVMMRLNCDAVGMPRRAFHHAEVYGSI
jgi:hypothetical protein